MSTKSLPNTNPVITKSSSEFQPDAYASIPAGELVVFAVQVLQADGVPVAVEEVVSTCFRLFPHSFALKNYFYWPDSALVTRRLHDAKEKGLLKGSATEGYETKVQGRQIAKLVAKSLGVSLPIPPKVAVITPLVVEEKKVEEKKEEPPSAPVVKAVVKQEVSKKEVQGKQKSANSEKKRIKNPDVRKQAAKPKKAVVTTPVKKKSAPKTKIQPNVGQKKTPKSAVKVRVQEKQKPVRPAPKPKPGVKLALKVQKKVQPVPTVKKKPVKAAPKPKAEKKEKQKQETIKKGTKANPQPAQLTIPLTPAVASKKAEAPAAKPKVKKEAQQTAKGEALTAVVVSKEEKVKAAKVIKQIEKSDAYQLYKRNGRRAQIGDFDFRNMLFATMESSAETLKRNTELFKRYAAIHFRTDLIAFLEFCEENFAVLLKVKVKGKK